MGILPKRNQIIVVTGGNGHLGQWVIAALTGRGYDVVNLSRNPLTRPGIAGVVWSRPVSALACDLTNTKDVSAIRETIERADAVIHLAAHVPDNTARNSEQDADATLRNVFAMIALLGALRGNERLRTVVYASSFEVYGIPLTTPICESHPTHPSSYYGASKLCGENILSLFSKSSKLACSSFRFPAIYGPGDRINRAIGNFIRSAAQGKDIDIYGDGMDLRDLIYVSDAAAAVVQAIELPASGVFNLSDGSGISVLRMVQEVKGQAKRKIEIRFHERKKPRHDFVLNSEHARKTLAWEPRTTLAEGVMAQLAWEIGRDMIIGKNLE